MYTYNKSFKTLPIEILPMYTHVNDCGFFFFRRKSCSFQEAEKKKITGLVTVAVIVVLSGGFDGPAVL